jgi:putative NADPH-quinone reductase
MKILIILGHPKKGSFNHAIARTAVKVLKSNNHEVIFHDLYDEGFNPVIDHEEIPNDGKVDSVVSKHCEEVAGAEGIIVVHPNWWGQPPAILKGWVDRVIRPGVAYTFKETDNGEGVPIGLLKAQTAIVFNTSNTLPDREIQVFGDPLETLWKNCIFSLCGVNKFYRRMYSVIVTSTLEERLLWLSDVEKTVGEFF